MAIRQKKKVLEILYTQFKEFELPLDIEHKSYVSIVGPRKSLNAISIKRSFKAWKYALLALRTQYPDLTKKPEPPAVKEAPKPSGLEALRAAKEANDE